MFKICMWSGFLSVAVATLAYAGDTVTVTMPGGAVQTVFSSAIASGIGNSAGGMIAISGGGTDSIISGVSQNSATGEITFTTVGGQSYTVSSAFIASIISYYGS